jgi:hypothetical protein
MAHRYCALLLFVCACGGDSAGTSTKSDAPASGSEETNGTTDGGAAADSSSGTPDPSSPPGDEGSGAWCGPAFCDATQECCTSDNGVRRCVTSGTCTGAAFPCDGSGQCGDGVCCGHAGTTICMLQSACNRDFGLAQSCYTDANCVHLPHQPKCCDAPNSWGKICRAQCGASLLVRNDPGLLARNDPPRA